ncbi:MAG: glycosyltransferase family 2 protein [Lachnospiraceae bacterium]
MKTVDIVVPCYNEEEVLETFYQVTDGIVSAMAGYSFTYILVDDGSRDSTLTKMKGLAAAHDNVRYISFSRNFGKEAAMYAGLSHTTGDLVIVMDADLQHPPAMIPEMMKGIEEGYDCAAARRTTRAGESKIRSAFSNLFYRLSNHMTDVKMPQAAVDFRIMTRQMVDSILKLSEVERFSKGIFAWVGFDTKWYPYENVERTMGTTKWSFRGLFKYAIDGITSFSIAPLRLVSGVGFVISIVAFIYILITLIQTLIFGIDVPGYVTTLCAVLFLGGIIELSIGILGEYIAHIYMEAKDRPIYIVKQTNLDLHESEKKGK